MGFAELFMQVRYMQWGFVRREDGADTDTPTDLILCMVFKVFC
ncbi:MAG: hypothetical protein CM1200mP41_30700 [Gammaproteobacteria bacterium]|nr:MAG: hypothetical protein CM1200mP41_30700 [Gammaproteobacteria bacterium]